MTIDEFLPSPEHLADVHSKSFGWPTPRRGIWSNAMGTSYPGSVHPPRRRLRRGLRKQLLPEAIANLRL